MKHISRKRYAVAGVSHRAFGMFMDPMLNTYKDRTELVAILDKDKSRMRHFNETRNVNIPTYMPKEFDKMIEQTKPEVIIVACPDSVHHEYVIKALKHDLDVIAEKPLTIDEQKCAAISAAAADSKGSVAITFNYRYAPHVSKIRELISQGKVGKVLSVDLNWYIDTYHGSSYFQRWNRLREISGGLSVHKCCHHFDLVQWWISQKPVEVFAYGALNFFGPRGVHNPLKPDQIGDGRTCLTCDVKNKCKYYMRWNRDEYRGSVSGQAIDEHVGVSRQYEGYSHRQCCFDPQINIEDTYSAVIKYDGGTLLNYSLNASTPCEGFRLGINGTEGRIEFKELHAPLRTPFPYPGELPIIYTPLFGGREQIDVINLGGDHGGGDPLLLDELFIGPDPLAPVKRQADLAEGIDVVLTGVAVYRSALEHRVISMEDLRKVVYGNKKNY